MSQPTPEMSPGQAAALVVAAVDAIDSLASLSDTAGLGATVSAVQDGAESQQQALAAVRDLALVVVQGVQASEADRASLHTQVSAAASAASTAQQAAATASTAAASVRSTASGAASLAASAKSVADAAKSVADAAKAAADKAALDLAALAARRSRSAPAVTVPAMLSLLGGAASVDVVVTWTTPWPDAEYAVVPVLDVPSALLGKVTAAVKSKTAASCTLTVTTSAVLSASTSTVRAISVST